MAMTCRGILALPYANRLRLVAGASGGGNEIRWGHILEEPKYTAWLKGGELILLSGVVTGDREGALLSLLQDLFDREVAGVVLNLSTFLPAIPPSVLALGDRLGLPLFEMPAEVRMVDVSQSIAFAIFQQRQKTGQVEGALRDLLTGIQGIGFADPFPNDLEVIAGDIDKGEALRFLLRHLGLEASQVLAMGDGGSDLPLLQAAGIGVAMANATEGVKAAADFVTTSCDEDGVAVALEKFVL